MGNKLTPPKTEVSGMKLKSYSYPELGKASLLLFKAFQKSIKKKEDERIQNAIAFLYKTTDGLLEAMDHLKGKK